MKKEKIVSIEIELKDYEPIKFTMAEAKELHEQLDALFGEKTKEVHHYRDWWTRPYYTWYNNTGTLTDARCVLNCANDLAGKSVASSSTNMKVSYLAS